MAKPGRRVLTSDLHLGHKNICRYRTKFTTMEEHDEVVFDNLATEVRPRDTIYFMGDITFSLEALTKIGSIVCRSKVLMLGNHDLERGVTMLDLLAVYNKIFSLVSNRNVWFSHCPIHPDEMRERKGNIHGHGHYRIINDSRYVNVCLEQTNYKPVLFSEVIDMLNSFG